MPRVRASNSAVARELEAALASNLNDVGAWLVYADWLEAQGDVRSELIRLRLRVMNATGLSWDERIGLRDQADELTKQHEQAWLAGWHPRVSASVEWRMGFVVEAAFPCDPNSIASCESLLATPAGRLLGKVSFIDLPLEQLNALDRLLGRGVLRRLTLLGSTDLRATPAPLQPGQAQRLAVVRTLDRVAGERLAKLSGLGFLHSLSVRDQAFGSAGFLALVEAERLRGLGELELGNDDPGLASLTVVGRRWALDSLRSLRLAECRLDDAGLRELITLLPAGLVSLDLRENLITDAGLATLVGSGKFSRLERLDLRNNSITSPAKPLAAQPSAMPSLRWLSLAHNQIGDSGAYALARTLSSCTLATLDLSSNPMSEHGYQALLETGWAADVELADLRG